MTATVRPLVSRRAARAHATVARLVQAETWRALPDVLAGALSREQRDVLDRVIDVASLMTVCAVIDERERRAS